MKEETHFGFSPIREYYSAISKTDDMFISEESQKHTVNRKKLGKTDDHTV